MKPRGSMSHSQVLSSNPYPEPNQPVPRIDPYLISILIASSHLRLGPLKGLFPVGLPVKIWKAFLFDFGYMTCSF